MDAPPVARDYYDLEEGAKLRDVFLSIRADESIHREFNHYLSDLKAHEEIEHEEVHIIDRETRADEPSKQQS